MTLNLTYLAVETMAEFVRKLEKTSQLLEGGVEPESRRLSSEDAENLSQGLRAKVAKHGGNVRTRLTLKKAKFSAK